MPNLKYQMYNPPHPGLLLKESMEGHNLSISKMAMLLGINRAYLSKIVNGKQGISVVMALRIAKLYGTGFEFWIDAQNAYDIWQAEQNTDFSKVKILIEEKQKIPEKTY